MNNWNFILDKMLDIESGTLRFSTRKKQMKLGVRVEQGESSSTICFTWPGEDLSEKLNLAPAQLIQRSEKGCLKASGYLSNLVVEGKNYLSLQVARAQWFVSKQKGNETWLEEVCQYEPHGANA